MAKHKYAELIKAWADGAEIEYRSYPDAKWEVMQTPTFTGAGDYRIKPENKLIPAGVMFDLHFRCHTNEIGKIIKVEVLNG